MAADERTKQQLPPPAICGTSWCSAWTSTAGLWKFFVPGRSPVWEWHRQLIRTDSQGRRLSVAVYWCQSSALPSDNHQNQRIFAKKRKKLTYFTQYFKKIACEWRLLTPLASRFCKKAVWPLIDLPAAIAPAGYLAFNFSSSIFSISCALICNSKPTYLNYSHAYLVINNTNTSNYALRIRLWKN